MVFDVLSVALLAAAGWFVWTHRKATVPISDLPAADLPPAAADEALPSARRLPHYVEGGLVELDDFLRRNEDAA